MSDMEIDTPDEMVTASSPPPREKADSKSTKRFEVIKWKAVALWSYDIAIDKCSICRSHVMDMCVQCEAEQKPGDECAAAWGTCNHTFHFHCISRWLQKKNTCPLCIRPWDYYKFA